MKGDYAIPPSRDLPPNRLAQRREHLISEIAQPPSRWPLPRRGLLALVAAALVVAVGTASAIGGVRSFILDRGFIGLPPHGATPSAPESGELVLLWSGDSATHATPRANWFDAPFVEARVYADGRMIWWRDGQVPEGASERMSGYLEQRLTPAGVELLRSEVVGLLDRSRALLETLPADDDPRPGPFGGLALFVPLDHGSGHGSVEVRDGDRLVRLQWRGNDAETEGTIATPEQLADLRRIDALLTDSTTVLPSSAWAVREVRAYVPSHYAVCIQTAPPKDASRLLSLLPARAADLLRDKSRTSFEADLVSNVDQVPGHMVVIGRSVTYCSKLATEEAREVANAVSGLARHPWPLTLMYDVAEGVDNLGPTTISFDPYFPDGQFLLFGGGR